MARKNIETMIPIPMDRGMLTTALPAASKAIKDSGVVDFYHVPDQLQSWWPPGMWNQQNCPVSAFMPDPDSNADPSVVAGIAASTAPGPGITLSTDAIRRGPAEMMQTMLSLANLGGGQAVLQLGAGEIKNTAPYGWKRKEGLRRYEDHLKYYDAFWRDDSGCVSTGDGHFWNFKNATIGGHRPHRPRMWALGGGPKLVDIAIDYADGFATMVPNVIQSPEAFAKFVMSTREELERRGRDPERFDFCPWMFVLIHEDPEVIENAFNNPLTKWMVANFGRFNNHDWSSYGLEPAFSPDYHYAMKLLPNWVTDQDYVTSVLKRVTREMFDLTFYCGSPKEVATHIQPYIEAGANVIDLIDFLAPVLSIEDSQQHLARQIEVCRLIKEKNQ
jgi:phthiodiolone/phenolphthiodiolone dimycocerosates ketoreductase